MSEQRSGFSYLRQGFGMLGQPGIRLYVMIPLLMNMLIFGTFMTFVGGKFSDYLNAMMNWLPDWLNFLRWIMWPLFVILLLATVGYLFSTVANILAAPFNGLLAEKVEEMLTGQEVTARETLGQALLSFPRSVLREIQKLLYYLLRFILVLILGLIVSPAAPFLSFGLGSWMMGLNYTDFAMDNNKLSFSEAKQCLAKQRLPAFSFGAFVMLGTMIPVLNLFIMPAAVCGGTALWVEKMRPESSKALQRRVPQQTAL